MAGPERFALQSVPSVYGQAPASDALYTVVNIGPKICRKDVENRRERQAANGLQIAFSLFLKLGLLYNWPAGVLHES